MPSTISTYRVARTVGLEFETVNLKIDRAQQIVDRASGGDRRRWQAKGDVSIIARNGASGTAEIVSPILKWGPRDAALTARVLGALNDSDVWVNSSCGTHCHVDARDMTRAEMIGVIRVYTALEPLMREHFFPASRKTSYWARSFDGVPRDYQRVDNNGDLYVGVHDWKVESNWESIILNNYDVSTRYMAVNLNAYPYHGTIEFRGRHATTNPRKALEWAGFCSAVMDLGKQLAGVPQDRMGDHLDLSVTDFRNALPLDELTRAIIAGESFSSLPDVTPVAPSLAQFLRLQQGR